MKYLIIAMLFSSFAIASDCTESVDVKKQQVVYKVDTQVPKHLKGATITITKSDGTSSTVPAEKFMVVPRKQATVVGENVNTSSTKVCKINKKHLLMLEARKDVKDLSVSTNGKSAEVYSNKEVIPGVNYYRGGLIENFGAGLGVDTNGTGKAILGFEF